ncbi:MAG: radical SAM protein [Candidatus Omnitrophica bacterium]|nr:radical SAM protein [Candidatus Omnitrophota bacterium]
MRSEIPPEVHGNGRFLLKRQNFTPAYLKTFEGGRLQEKIDQALGLLASCTVCPRNCRIKRLEGEICICKTGRYAKVASFSAHLGEEDILRGSKGSGTIFFSGCNLGCVFCQNYDISQEAIGGEVSPKELARILIRLQEAGCHNINFVTPEHVVPQILEALPDAIRLGLRLPLVYNTGAYDSLDSIRLMDGVVDIYMPDFKLWNEETCRKYLLAPDYAFHAKQVIRAMHGQVGVLKVDEEGLALRGVLVRHLVMPEMSEDTAAIVGYLAQEISKDTYINVMDQYYPSWKVMTGGEYREIDRRILPSELRQAYQQAQQAGLWRFDTRWRRDAPV